MRSTHTRTRGRPQSSPRASGGSGRTGCWAGYRPFPRRHPPLPPDVPPVPPPPLAASTVAHSAAMFVRERIPRRDHARRNTRKVTMRSGCVRLCGHASRRHEASDVEEEPGVGVLVGEAAVHEVHHARDEARVRVVQPGAPSRSPARLGASRVPSALSRALRLRRDAGLICSSARRPATRPPPASRRTRARGGPRPRSRDAAVTQRPA